MTSSDGSTLRQRMIQILTANPQNIAIIQLFEFQASTTGQNQILIRQTILLVLENHHDWNQITKCLHFWKGLDRYIKSLYKRMKERLQETYDINIPIVDMEADLQRMFDKHSQVTHNKAQPLNIDIDKFLNKDYKKDPSLIGENSANNITVANQKNENSNPIQSQTTTKDISKIALLHNDNISEKSNSISSKSSNMSNMRMIEKKTTFGMLRRQEGNSNSTSSNSNLVSTRRTSRRAFGQGNELRSVQVQKKFESLRVEQKQESNNTKIQPPNKQDLIDFIKEPQRLQQQLQTQQTKKTKPQEGQIRKLNIFERKQQAISKNASNRSNAHFSSTNQSSLNTHNNQPQQQLLQPKSKQKRLQSSLSKSVTPHKPLAHRKKIILKKPSDFQQNFFDSDDEFSSIKKFNSHDQSYNTQLCSDDKNSFPNMNSEELELRNELQNEFSSKQSSFDNGSDSVEREMRMVSKERERNSFNPEKKEQKKFQSKQKMTGQYKKNAVQTSMVRQPDQLFSDYEVSLMGFNPRQHECETTYQSLMDKCKTWSWKGECNKWEQKIQKMKDRRKERQNNVKR